MNPEQRQLAVSASRAWFLAQQWRTLILFILAALVFFMMAPASAKQAFGEGCGPLKTCGDGLSCHPFIQKCYHNPRKRDEPCMAGHSCGAGLTCQAGSQTCVGPGRDGDSCHLTKPCGNGLTCEAGRQKCVGPAKDGEACHLTKPCGSGLTCEAGRQKCVGPAKDGEACHLTKPCGKDLTCMPGSQTCSAGGRPIALPNDFPPPAAAKPAAQRLAECDASKDPKCYARGSSEKMASATSNCLYGWNVGKGHPASNTNPPDYSNLINALDQCAYFHDRGAWQFNRTTKTCEHWTSCSNSMGLSRCMERFQPRNKDEADAKACFIDNFKEPMKACIPALYQDWGAEYATAPSGEQWLSAKSIADLRGAMKQCPGNMTSPGFPEK